VFSALAVLALLMTALPMQMAQAATTIIAQWTFESPNTPAGATAAVYPNAIAPAVGSGNAGGVHTSVSTAWSTPVGNGSAASFSSNNWAVGSYYQFNTSTAGFTGISVSWDQTGSSTGPRDFKLAYSTDGTTFTDFGSAYSLPSPAVSWSGSSTSLATKFSQDLSSITVLDNQPNVYFRLIDTSTVSISGGTVGTGGTDRVDNFTVRGTGDQAPYVASTVPANGATDVPVNSSITINFSEPVNTTGQWFSIVCATSGDHSASVTVTGGPTSFTLDPGTDFVGGELCTLTVYAANVNDVDLIDPPDNMVVNFTAGFTTVTPPLPIGTVNGPVPDSNSCATHTSPYVGQTVKIQGVIYEKTLQAISNSTNTYKGFFIQNTAATADSDPTTSDGLFVFMSTADNIGGYSPQVGDEVILSGKVQEYYNMTELVAPFSSVQVINSDAESQIVPVEANPPISLADANCYWERLQGMRVQVPQNSIVLGGRNVFSPADAEIWLARPDSTVALRNSYASKAYRDAHPLDDNYDPTNWDGNGYRILIGSLGIKATAGDAQALIAPARAYSRLTNAPAGGLNYTFSKYRIEISDQPTFNEGADPAANNPPTVFDHSIHFTIADYNLENLYDYRDNPFSGCDFAGNPKCLKAGTPFLSDVTPPYDYVPASDAVYQARLNDIALQIINDLHGPDILMVQEVENQDICTVECGALVCGTTDNADGKPDVLQELALKVASLGGPAYDAAWDRHSSDLRGIAPAFLYRTDRVQLVDPTGDPILGTSPAIVYSGAAVAYNSDVSNPKTLNATLPTGVAACETSWVFPRAPDIGLFRIYSTSVGVGSYRDVYLINNHFKSSPDTCVSHRTEQAKYNSAIVAFLQAANPNALVVVGGDLNVYPRPDDPFAPIGQPLSSDQLGSLYDPSLGQTNLWEVLLGQAPESAYSYVYLGMAQTLDQMFINAPLLADLKQFRIAHINSDFPADYAGDVARGTSDHDPNVATFDINFSGFFPPIDNPPAVNSAKAGSAVPVKFSLGGDKGMNIFVNGYPQSVQINCSTGVPIGSSDPTANPGGSKMSYGGGQYNYVWKTEKAWSGTCRQLIVKLIDGTVQTANFKFK
jgi:predicted extracellular nuclease